MRVRRNRLGRVCAAGCLLATGAAIVLTHSGASAADADIFATKANFSFGPPGAGVITTESYSVAAAANPLPVCYVDPATLQTGGCLNLSGSGGVDVVDCIPSGPMSATWSLTESGPDTTTFAGSGVMIGSVALLAAAPSTLTPSDGYYDPSSTSTPGRAVAVAVMLPLTQPKCGGATNWGGVVSVVGSAP